MIKWTYSLKVFFTYPIHRNTSPKTFIIIIMTKKEKKKKYILIDNDLP